LTAVHIDGALIFFATLFGQIALGFGADTAYQYVKPVWVFLIRIFCSALSSAFIALIGFRNQTYAKWIRDQNGSVDKPTGAEQPPKP